MHLQLRWEWAATFLKQLELFIECRAHAVYPLQRIFYDPPWTGQIHGNDYDCGVD